MGEETVLVEGAVEGLARGPWPVEGVVFDEVDGTERGGGGGGGGGGGAVVTTITTTTTTTTTASATTFAGDVCTAWGFLAYFSSLLAIAPPTVDGLVAGLLPGVPPPGLFKVYSALLRLLQVDAEESKGMVGDDKASGGRHAASGGGHHHHPEGGKAAGRTQGAHSSHSRYTDAALLEEAWSWGFDVDCWRAHMNEATWTEICRQVCIAAGLGRRRPLRSRSQSGRTKSSATGVCQMGKLGEDMIVVPETGQVELRLPGRLVESSVKGACWMVLKDAGVEGLHVDEIAKRIQRTGLRDLRTSKTPETSVAGAMGRDALFERLAPGTYALSSVLRHHDTLLMGVKNGNGMEEVKDDETMMDQDRREEDREREEGDEEEQEEEQEEEEEEEEFEGEPSWLAKLMESSYEALSMEERASMLADLCHLCIDSMTVRLTLQRRYDEQQRIKRVKLDDDKVFQNLVKARKQVEAAEKARKDEHAAKVSAAKAAAEKEGRPFKEEDVPGMADNNSPTAEEALLAKKVVEAEDAVKKAALMSGLSAKEGTSVTDNLEEFNKERVERALKELQMSPIRIDPLGTDRRWNKYWRLAVKGGAGGDDAVPVESEVDRIYVEMADGSIKYIPDASSLDTFIKSLNDKGPRERALKASLLSIRGSVTMPAGALPVSNPTSSGSMNAPTLACDLTPCATEVVISEDVEAGYGGEARTTEDAIRRGILRVCSVLDEYHVVSAFDKEAFLARVPGAQSLVELRALLGDLEGGIKQACIHSDFKRDPLLVKGAWIPVGSEVATAAPGSSFADQMLSPGAKGSIASGTAPNRDAGRLAWLPLTTSSIALRLMSLDASIIYRNDTCGRQVMPGYRATQRPFPGAIDSVVESMYCINGGHVDAAYFAPFPYRLTFGPRMDYVFDLEQLKEDIEKGSDAPLKPLNHAQATSMTAAAHTTGRSGRGGRGGRSGSRGRGRGGRGRGRGGRGRGRGRGVLDLDLEDVSAMDASAGGTEN